MNDQRFIYLWNKSESAQAFADAAGIPKRVASVRAFRLRSKGLPVKRMPWHIVQTITDRFWLMVRKTDSCWLWTGSVNRKGYGQISTKRGNRPLQAHRFSYRIHFGRIPSRKMVLHKCDNPSCVNPDHLFLGTAKQNTDDMITKERGHWQRKAPGKLRRVNLALAEL